jgi:pimeloyl-ACP methyl ester carboxylesterase
MASNLTGEPATNAVSSSPPQGLDACSVDLRPRAPAAELPLAEVLRRFRSEAEHGTCHTGRYRCPYYSWGSGPPLVFIPGLSTDALSFAPVVAHLSTHFRCTAYDYPLGRGDGARLGRLTHADLVADLFALFDHLATPRSYVFGFSFGSTVALAAMKAQPERIPRAILQGGFACRRLAPAEVLLARLTRHCWAPMRRLPFYLPLLRRHLASFADRPAEVWQFFLDLCTAPPMAPVAYRALLLHQFDMTGELAAVRQPVLLVTGDCDPLVGPDCTEVLRRGLADAVHVELTHCGHFPILSHPGVLAEVVRQFLTPACAAESCER